MNSKQSRHPRLLQVALSQKTPFGVSEIQNLVPAMGRELIKKVLFKLRDEKEIVLTGKGRGAKWEVIRKILP
jgi:hypothetical protein